MLATIILLTFVAAAFWRETLKLAIAALIAVLVLGTVQVAQFVDEAGLFDQRASSEVK